MSTYNLAVTFTVTPLADMADTETTFSQGFITLVSIENQYRITLVEVRGGDE